MLGDTVGDLLACGSLASKWFYVLLEYFIFFENYPEIQLLMYWFLLVFLITCKPLSLLIKILKFTFSFNKMSNYEINTSTV